MKKEVLLGNFVYKDKILSYLEFIHNKYKVKYENLFIYEVSENKNEYLITFKIESANRKNYKDIKGAHVLHFKRGALFSINALNALIDSLNQDNAENNKDYELDWEQYSNKLILNAKNELSIKDIKKIEDKNNLFS